MPLFQASAIHTADGLLHNAEGINQGGAVRFEDKRQIGIPFCSFRGIVHEKPMPQIQPESEIKSETGALPDPFTLPSVDFRVEVEVIFN